MPGVSNGLNLLRIIHDQKEQICLKKDSHSLFDGVMYYDFIENKITEYCFVSLNSKLDSIYTEHIVNNKIVLYNKLYWIFCDVYTKLYSRFEYKYNRNMFDMHDIIKKFFHSLRKNITNESLKFYVKPVLEVYSVIQYFDPSVIPEQYYMFLFDFILDLWGSGVLIYNKNDHSIVFNSLYEKDLINLIYFSFDLMLLGDNKIISSYDLSDDNIEFNLNSIYSTYTKSNDIKKSYINDLLNSLVIASSTGLFCAGDEINNIFVESIRYGANINKKQ